MLKVSIVFLVALAFVGVANARLLLQHFPGGTAVAVAVSTVYSTAGSRVYSVAGSTTSPVAGF